MNFSTEKFKFNMKNLFFIAISVFLLEIPSIAQENQESETAVPIVEPDTTFWISEFSAGLNFNQAGFRSNWKAGGVNSVAFGSIVAGKAFYQKDRFSWDN